MRKSVKKNNQKFRRFREQLLAETLLKLMVTYFGKVVTGFAVNA